MLKYHRHICTGSTCKVCRHLGRQRAARALKHGPGPSRPDRPGPSPAASRGLADDHGPRH